MLNADLDCRVAEMERTTDGLTQSDWIELKERADEQRDRFASSQKTRGRPRSQKERINRKPEAYMCEDAYPRIRLLWKKHYGKTMYGKRSVAIAFALSYADEQIIADDSKFFRLLEQIEQHLQRPKARSLLLD